MQRKVVLSFAILLCLTAAAQAALSITVGAHQLQPNQAGQTVDINIAAAGGEQLQGINFRAQLGDGGPGVGGSDITPAMTGDLIGVGTIFELNNNGVNDGSVPPSYLDVGTTTQGTSFQVLSAGDNLLIQLVFDTTGFTNGAWSLVLSETIGGSTNTGGGEELAITDGSITVVPEPSSVVLGLFAVAGFGVVAIRKRRSS